MRRPSKFQRIHSEIWYLDPDRELRILLQQKYPKDVHYEKIEYYGFGRKITKR